MAITAKRGVTREPVPAGMYPARLYKIIHYGTIPGGYEGKLTNTIRLEWELPTKMKVFDPAKGEQPLSISKEYTLSMNEKANLCKDVESWEGKKFELDSEVEKYNILDLIGKECMINVAHKTAKSSGNVYSYVASVSPMPEGMECPMAINPPFIFDYDENFDEGILENLHKFFQDKIKSSAEYQTKMDPIDIQDAPFPEGVDEPQDLQLL